MQTKEQGSSFVRIGATGWVSVHVTNAAQTVPAATASESLVLARHEPASCRLFERTAGTGLTLSERFPRLTVAVIALALLAFSVTAEIEYLSKAGYYWQ